jgi:glycosyltransferase involved in cell wall biosynthesis
MRIAQVATADIHGGAARAGYRLHRGLIGLGQESALLVLDKTSTDDTVRQLRAEPAADEFALRCLQGIQRDYIDANRTPISNTLFSLPYPGHDLTGLDEVGAADVINLHWVARLQSPGSVRQLLRLGKPVVWTLHDMWPFTGGCHYSAGCGEYQAGCSPCPQLADDPHRLPAAVLKDKLEALADPRLVVVAPSEWLAGCARRSRLFRETRVEVIPYSLETDAFAPLPKAEAKHRLGLRPETMTILAGAHEGRERRKGFSELAEALRMCADDPQVRQWVSQDALTLLWFGHPPADLAGLAVPAAPLNWITGDERLREIYSAADVYVLPSLEDNLPNTMLEAMSCGTPVVAFGVGGVPEIMADGITGRVVSAGDARGLGAAILDCLRHQEERAKMGQVCRHLIETNHAMPVQAQRYLDLYRELVGRGREPGPSRPARAPRNPAGAATEVPEPGDGLVVPLDTAVGPAFERILAPASFRAVRSDFEAMSAELRGTQAAWREAKAEVTRAHVERDRSHSEINWLRGRIAAMESAKFWKLRTLWFRFRRRIGVPGQE